MGKVYVRLGTPLLNEERLKKILKEVGIKKYEFSNCLKKCICKRWEFKRDDVFINLGLIRIKFSVIDRIRRAWALLLGERVRDIFYEYFVCGFVNKNIIGINVRVCIEDEKNIKDVLKHEIVHLVKIGHCASKKCLMYEGMNNGKSKKFCKSCEKIYNKIIEQLNDGTYK